MALISTHAHHCSLLQVILTCHHVLASSCVVVCDNFTGTGISRAVQQPRRPAPYQPFPRCCDIKHRGSPRSRWCHTSTHAHDTVRVPHTVQGFAELEYGILGWMGAVDANTPGVSAVHCSHLVTQCRRCACCQPGTAVEGNQP